MCGFGRRFGPLNTGVDLAQQDHCRTTDILRSRGAQVGQLRGQATLAVPDQDKRSAPAGESLQFQPCCGSVWRCITRIRGGCISSNPSEV